VATVKTQSTLRAHTPSRGEAEHVGQTTQKAQFLAYHQTVQASLSTRDRGGLIGEKRVCGGKRPVREGGDRAEKRQLHSHNDCHRRLHNAGEGKETCRGLRKRSNQGTPRPVRCAGFLVDDLPRLKGKDRHLVAKLERKVYLDCCKEQNADSDHAFARACRKLRWKRETIKRRTATRCARGG